MHATSSLYRSRRLLGVRCLLVCVSTWTAACGDSAERGADLSEELSGGEGVYVASAGGVAVPDGYELHEYLATGVATAYAAGEQGLPDDGRWDLLRTTTAPYRTRVVVRRPAERAAASGTVIVEWLNVSGGVDADPEYATLAEEITRAGHIWVGVSAQLVGVEGGAVLVSTGVPDPNAGAGLRTIDPERYGSLSHPGDGYAFDIFTQIARTLRRGGAVLGGVRPSVLIAAGESQSAMALSTYYNGVQSTEGVFDGFFVHSRAGFTLPLVGEGEYADITRALFTRERPVFRDDLDAPVMNIQTESDTFGILSSYRARQADSSTFRLWEIAGTAHADRHLLGFAAEFIDCTVPINDGPTHLVAKAALRALDLWVRTGATPPTAPRIELSEDATNPVPLRDVDGIALGGVRTPLVDVPVDILSGVPGSSSIICLLLGSTTPLPTERLAELYESRTDYEQQFEASAVATIAAGFTLEDDHAALTAYSQPARVEAAVP
ncbi:MAG: hypothetical protein KC593_21185 [Myxococcales bacterium]|nr:hypothetical protein [Myxococcales bacterium]